MLVKPEVVTSLKAFNTFFLFQFLPAEFSYGFSRGVLIQVHMFIFN